VNERQTEDSSFSEKDKGLKVFQNTCASDYVWNSKKIQLVKQDSWVSLFTNTVRNVSWGKHVTRTKECIRIFLLQELMVE